MKPHDARQHAVPPQATDTAAMRTLLQRVAAGEVAIDDALASLRALPFEDLGFAKVDHHRALRTGAPEVVYCAGKTPAQVAAIFERLAERGEVVLGTRASAEQYEAVASTHPGKACADAKWHELARCIYVDRRREPVLKAGVVLCAAGTSDLPVAEEAGLTLELMGHAPQRVYDVGVAGLHRLLPHVEAIQRANVVIAVAGMEGALASVVGGLASAPVIAVPTSVGYGASFGGIAALLAMLNSCATGVSVVNIDNGFGAGMLAAKINALASKS